MGDMCGELTVLSCELTLVHSIVTTSNRPATVSLLDNKSSSSSPAAAATGRVLGEPWNTDRITVKPHTTSSLF